MNLLRHALTPARALLLAAALLLAQAAGLAHRVAHGGLGGMPPAAAAAAAKGAASVADVPGKAFAQHAPAGVECRLFDQLLGHADALLAQTASVTPAAPSSLAALAAALPARSACAAAYRARGPPAA